MVNEFNIQPELLDAGKASANLGERLHRGELGVILGSGVSRQYGAPAWDRLIDGLWHRLQEEDADVVGDILSAYSDVPGGSWDSLTDGAQIAYSCYCRINKLAENCESGLKFAAFVGDVLWEEVEEPILVPEGKDLFMLALYCLATGRQGRVSEICTFNYDDIVECNLRALGLDCTSLEKWPALVGGAEVTVFHPHGLIPANRKKKSKVPLVLGRSSYIERVGELAEQDKMWAEWMKGWLLRKQVMICGLGAGFDTHNIPFSYADKILTSDRGGRRKYVGYWVLDNNDYGKYKEKCLRLGCCPVNIENYSALPKFLLDIKRHSFR